ncbi:MAG: polyphosphate kinase 1 [Runella sp.]
MPEQPQKHSPRKTSLTSLFSFMRDRRENKENTAQETSERALVANERLSQTIEQSNLISRDLSWIQFNLRVLDQARSTHRTLFERLKFLAISDSNLDEFFAIRVGSLYNYLDYGKERIDYSGLREIPFRKALMSAIHKLAEAQDQVFEEELLPLFEQHKFKIGRWGDLSSTEKQQVGAYFDRTIHPMLTPMLYDYTHTFPVLLAKTLIFGIITKAHDAVPNDDDHRKLSFVQIPANLPRFYTIERPDGEILFVPIEEIMRYEMHKLYRNVEILSMHLFRIVRNGDISTEESDDVENDFVDEIKQKLKNRRLGRVVRMEIEPDTSEWMLNLLKKRWEIDDYNIFTCSYLLDFTCLWQIIKHPEFAEFVPPPPAPVLPLGVERNGNDDIFEIIKDGDILLHHPYNNFEPVLELLEEAAEDPNVLAIKLTIYRLAKKSRVTEALLKAAENGKHVAVLFEVKARFDEENNIREAQRLQKAGCFVIYGISKYKTHTKLLQIVRAEGQGAVSYSHLASGNYNEETAKLYTDIGLLTCDPVYNRDITEFFNVITGHSQPQKYQYLITAPKQLRTRIIEMIRNEASNAQKGLPSGICFKVNSLEDKATIEELYKASQAGVPIKLIVRGICCLRPGRKGLSENITVRSIVGDFLEHTRLLYFHNAGQPKVFGGSADLMVRSFDRRIESMFELVNPRVKQQAIHILDYNLRDTVNAYELLEDGSYCKCESETTFDIHKAFFEVTLEEVMSAQLFVKEQSKGNNEIASEEVVEADSNV